MGFHCRSCSHSKLSTVVDLGPSPLANRLLTENDLDGEDERFPLTTVFCERCSLVQITETVPPEILFKHYRYFSSVSDALLKHAAELTREVVARRNLDADSLVVEIASNDGYLLKNYVEAGIPALGIDPAENVAKVAREKGVPTLAEFFGTPLAREMASTGRMADVIHANNVLAHVADTNGFVEGIRTILKPDGIAVLEVPYVRDLIQKCEFDTIYHEHLCYFSVTSLSSLFARHGLAVQSVQLVPIHGGSLRVWVVHEERAPDARDVDAMIDLERSVGMDRFGFYRDFGRRVEELRVELRSLVGDLRADGRRIWGYGAAAKATVLLNYVDIGPDTIECIADLSPHKQGCYVPGVRIPIVSPERLREDPDYLLLLAWNFADEIRAQQKDYERRGGRFIVPVPRVEIL